MGPLIGRGAMGQVYDGRDIRLGRAVAIKLLRHDLADQPEARRRFEEEARSAARLSDPHVVAVYDFGEADGIPYIVMERLPGTTLADELRAGPLTEARACQVATCILSALQSAHAAGVLHRDIKPGNVLLTVDHLPKVADFGIAKAGENSDSTATGMILGTPAYLAPERLSGYPASPASDVYAVGVLLWECLAGQRPFNGDTPFAVTTAVMTQPPPPLAPVRPDVQPSIIATIEHAMAKDPAARFQSAAEMRSALTRRPGPVVMPRRRPQSSRTAVLTLLAIFLLLACIAVGIAIANQSSSPSSTTPPSPPVSGALGNALDNLQRAVQR
jgi:serine/threonine protein kinase